MKNIDRRTFAKDLMAGVGLATMAGFAPGVWARDEPVMRIIVPFAAGGGGDILGRLFADKLAEVMDRTIIVENKPGASSTIGSDYVAHAKPDGNTILLNVPLLIQSYYTMPKLSYDPFTDLVPVVDLVTSALWFAINPEQTPVDTVKELVEEAKKHPKTYSYGTLGAGSTSHVFGNLLNKAAGTDLLAVPYKGSSEIAKALVGGEITLAILDLVTLGPLADAGKVKLIGVTGTERSPLTPDVPTLTEQGFPGFELATWAGFFVPKGTPDEAIKALHDASVKVMHLPEIERRIASLGYIPGGKSVADFQKQFAAERDRWGQLMKDAIVDQ